MNIAVHLYFNMTKLIFSCVSRRDNKFLIFELIGSLILIAFALFFDNFIHEKIVIKSGILDGINYFLYGLFYFSIFVGTSFVSRLTNPKNPEEVAFSNKKNVIIRVGIVDFTWICIIGITYAGILFCREFDTISGNILTTKSPEYYNLFYDEVKYLFDQAINIILILGTILAACMTILWGSEIWRKKTKDSPKEYKSTTEVSIKIVIAYFIIIIALIIWICLPLYIKMTSFKVLL
jgi:hypothetical protein